MTAALAGVLGALLAVILLWDVFETVLLPRRSAAPIRPSRLVFRALWWGWRAVAHVMRPGGRRETFLSFYPILTLLLLLGIWAAGLILSFGLLFVAAGMGLETQHGHLGFGTAVYMSGSTFLTLGLGDVVPLDAVERTITVFEAGTGLGFLALFLSYMPVLYQSFSRREARITLLDSWSGSPPSSAVVLRRNAESGDPVALARLLREWESASADLLESLISYPVLAYFRSQHDNQSWLASLTAVLDTCALVMAGVEGIPPFQARLTFAIARHAVVDVAQVFRQPPCTSARDRLAADDFARLRQWLAQSGVKLIEGPEADDRLRALRAMYEPYVIALSQYLLMPLPTFLPPERLRFNWQTTAWARTGRDAAH
ncbi:MAG TPA: potassium channel family protein [Candidatus Eisenbacteria bacterium]|nr:potassium channel family protein [Candidatus Eisenbacteria bacterium]